MAAAFVDRAGPGTSYANFASSPEDLLQLEGLSDRLIVHFDAHREALIAATSSVEFATHRQAAVALRQAVEIGLEGGGAVRDRIMADNVDWILAQEGPSGRLVLWAHNGHVMHGSDRAPAMGGVLEERHGDDHLTVGFIFGAGGFQAFGPSEWSERPRLRPFVVEPAPDTLEATFSRVEVPNFYIDLRRAIDASPAVWAWLVEEQRTRWIGSGFNPNRDQQAWLRSIRLAREFDIAVMTMVTTPARPLASAAAPPQ